jgi:pyruvate-ferredoxin/flavodoxin oxidoreductase
MNYQKEAVACGYWPLYHYDPREFEQPFHLDSRAPAGDFKEFALKEGRFNMLYRAKPDESERLLALGKNDIDVRWERYAHMAGQAHAAGGAQSGHGDE